MGLTSSERNTLHLHTRAGFGLRPDELATWAKLSITEQVDQLFKRSENFTAIDVVKFETNVNDLKQMNDGDKQKARKQVKEQLKELNRVWINRLSTDPAALREKMTLFWNNHFACRSERADFMQGLNNIHRKHALGNFQDLLLDVSKSPAMLLFLNNQQNKKEHPNENFARELLELFTLGRGKYTEADVKEAARAFTGWAFNRQTGEFEFRAKQHDDLPKKFRGKDGNFNGEDIVQLVLADRQTAVFLSQKLYRYFVSDDENAVHVEELASALFDSKYDISAWLKKMLTANWFYEEKNQGNLIKSPIELIAGLHVLFQPTYSDPDALLFVQRVLGQLLFYPPNVAGWPGGKNWIDSSTLLVRMSIGAAVVSDGEIESEEKDDAPEDFEVKKSQTKRKLQATPDWNAFEKAVPSNWQSEELRQFLLRIEPSKTILEKLLPYTVENRKAIVVQVLSLPEYQLH